MKRRQTRITYWKRGSIASGRGGSRNSCYMDVSMWNTNCLQLAICTIGESKDRKIPAHIDY